ncbi:phage holin family protein [Acinetobacter haemolyticus]|uniref:phage holin family protein n=1 Tax=Acinetobacter haemolyticus TaxID=29430 RepID=UPI00205A8250|nr:MAG TPA: holin [Caudoviricetes sp.]
MWDEFFKNIQPFGTAIASFVMAFFMGILRTAKTGKADIIESIMCGLFAVGIWSCLEWFGVPQLVAVGMASGVGYFGTHWVGNFFKTWLGKI